MQGKSSTGDEREVAKKVAGSLAMGAADFSVVFEGREANNFWAHLGGKGKYFTQVATDKGHKGQGMASRDPRLFQCSNASGRFQGNSPPCGP